MPRPASPLGCRFSLCDRAPRTRGALPLIAWGLVFAARVALQGAEVPVVVIDDATGKPVAARVYVIDDQGGLLTPPVESDGGEALKYEVRRGSSQEVHTAVSAHPFRIALPPGQYRVLVERGHEYLPASAELVVTEGTNPAVELRLKRWIHMAERGWYSGDTHLHLPLAEVPTRMLAEDLHVTFPLSYWVTDTAHRPSRDNKAGADHPEAELRVLEPDRVIWPVNTEYEIFTVGGARHTLGAFFALRHRRPLDLTVPPVGPVVSRVREEGGFLELDKHNWPWSMMLLPVADVDLFELSNNHLWRTEFLFRDWYPEYAADWMDLEMDDEGGFTEAGWREFGFRNYYALVNCGFGIQPTAGTACGVHPVPPGFGRVYVHLEDGFDFDRWVEGLKAGRSFVSTGPMLEVQVLGQAGPPDLAPAGGRTLFLAVSIATAHPLSRIELVQDGEVTPIPGGGAADGKGGTRLGLTLPIQFRNSGWVAVRCYERRPDGRERFAHSAPIRVEVPGKPLRPRRVEVEYLLGRVEAELTRHRGVLDDASIAEFERARDHFQRLLSTAR